MTIKVAAILLSLPLLSAASAGGTSPEPDHRAEAGYDSAQAAGQSNKSIPLREYRRLLLAHSWVFSTGSSEPDHSVPDNVPMFSFTFKDDGTWTRRSHLQLGSGGSPTMEKGMWTLDGDQLQMIWSGRRDDPKALSPTTIRFLTPHRLKKGAVYWNAEIRQDE
jgi:hypothetical protein